MGCRVHAIGVEARRVKVVERGARHTVRLVSARGRDHRGGVVRGRDVLFPPAVLGDEAFVVRDVENVGRVREDGVFLLELRFLVDGELPRCGDGGVEWEGKFDFIHDGIFDFSLGFSLGFGRRGVRVKGAGHSGV